MRTIALTRGKVAVVDDGDFERISKFKWHAYKDQHHTWHARSSQRGKTILMHRFIMGFSPGDPDVDHRDGDGLNNRRSNLRKAHKAGNASNIAVRADSVSGIKGIRRAGKKWSAQIKSCGKFRWLGTFDTKEDAAKAYDRAAIEHHGEFARGNYL